MGRARFTALALWCLSPTIGLGAPLVVIDAQPDPTPSAIPDIYGAPTVDATAAVELTETARAVATGGEPTAPLIRIDDVPADDDRPLSVDDFSKDVLEAYLLEAATRSGMFGGGSALRGGALSAGTGDQAMFRPGAIKKFMMGHQQNLDIFLQGSRAPSAGGAAPGSAPANFEEWSEPVKIGGPKPAPVSATGSGESVLHRIFCMLGLISPESAGLNEDCEYGKI